MGYKFDLAHTSVLKRAHTTLEAVLKEVRRMLPSQLDSSHAA